jgi:hypothetical protein
MSDLRQRVPAINAKGCERFDVNLIFAVAMPVRL